MDFDIQTFISIVGLPGAMCIYQMVVTNKTIQANTKVMTMIAAKIGVDPSEVSAK